MSEGNGAPAGLGAAPPPPPQRSHNARVMIDAAVESLRWHLYEREWDAAGVGKAQILREIREWTLQREADLSKSFVAKSPMPDLLCCDRAETCGGRCKRDAADSFDNQPREILSDGSDDDDNALRRHIAADEHTSVNPLAFMTLTHDAIRGGLAKAIELLAQADTHAEGCRVLEQTSRLIDLHTKQEDEVFFPYLRACSNNMHLHSDDDHDEAVQRRRDLVVRVKASKGVEPETLKELSALRAEYEIHMRGEEKQIVPLVAELTLSNSDSIRQATHLLIKYDLNELLAHAVPFTTFQLCKTSSYAAVKSYASTLKSALTKEAYVKISKAMLMSAFEARPTYAARLVADHILTRGDPQALPEAQTPLYVFDSSAVPKTRKGVASWLEKEQEGDWTWKDVAVERSSVDNEALVRAERLHIKLAERFSEPLRLKHVLVEEKKGEKTVYFFIDNVWEMSRRALFAKLYTRTHKEKKAKLHVVIIDAKERRTLARREEEAGQQADEPGSPDGDDERVCGFGIP